MTELTKEDFIKIGLIAAKEFNCPVDAKIDFIFPNSIRYVASEYIYPPDQSKYIVNHDEIILRRWVEPGKFEVSIGYSEKCNTLVISQIDERYWLTEWIEEGGKG